MKALQLSDDTEIDGAPHQALNARSLVTNGFAVELPEHLEVLIRDFPDPKEVKAERERLKDYWSIHWVGGKLYHLRLQGGGPNVEGTSKVLKLNDCAWLLRARLDDTIGSALPKYAPLRQRPFTFLAQKSALIKQAAEKANIQHPLLSYFRVTPKFILNSKTYEPEDGKAAVGLFVTVGMHYDIDAPLSELQAAGVSLNGMYVVKRIPSPGERRLVGRISSINGTTAHLSEATGPETAPQDELKLEGSKENFSSCLKTLLGYSYKRLTDAVEHEEAAYRLGPNFDNTVDQMGIFLRKTPIVLAQGISAKIGDRIVLDNNSGNRNVYTAPVVDYVFDRTGSKSDSYAWRGLSQFGPYDRPTFATKSPRILVVFPASTRGKVEAFLKSLRDGMGATYRGFSKGFCNIFGLVSVDFVLCEVTVPSNKALVMHNGLLTLSCEGSKRDIFVLH